MPYPNITAAQAVEKLESLNTAFPDSRVFRDIATLVVSLETTRHAAATYAEEILKNHADNEYLVREILEKVHHILIEHEPRTYDNPVACHER